MQDSTYDKLTAGTVVNESVTSSKTAGLSATLSKSSLRDGACGTITQFLNGTVDGTVIAVGNFTQTGCSVVNKSSMATWHTALLFSYPYTYSKDNSATDVMNDTTSSVAGVTEWFDIFIVIGAMVVLILLTVVIITAIRSSGMVADGSA